MDQAARLREMSRILRLPEKSDNEPRIIAVTSGKGGVGKSNIVLNLAMYLAKQGKKIVILDADVGMASIEVLMGITSSYSLYDVFSEKIELEQVVVDGPWGVKLIPGGNGLQGLGDFSYKAIERMYQGLEHLVRGFDFLFIDTGAGISKSVLGFLAAAQEVIVVATPEPTSITDAYSMIKILSVYRITPKIHLIINQAVNQGEAENTRGKMDMVTRKFLQKEVNYLGAILEDQSVSQAVRQQRPFISAYPDSIAAKGINQVASALLHKERDAETDQKGVRKLIEKLVRCFGSHIVYK